MFRTALRVARPITRPSAIRSQLAQVRQVRQASASLGQDPKVTLSPEPSSLINQELDDDPNMNGNYPDLPPIKRALRDPYDRWDDPQERRNFGEPIHEDNDILQVFSTDVYSHFSAEWGLVLMATFVGTVLAGCGLVSYLYPDTPSVSRTFPDGLEAALGGPRAMTALKDGDE